MTMMTLEGFVRPERKDDYLTGKRQAWFAFAMTFALMEAQKRGLIGNHPA